MPEVAVRLKTRYGDYYCMATTLPEPATAHLLLFLLLLLLFFKFLLLFQLVLTLLLGFLGRLLLTGFDIGLVLRGIGLLLLKALLLLHPLLRLLRALLTRFLELALEIALLLIVSLGIGCGLRRTDAALRLIQRMLLLLLLIGLFVGAALRRLGCALRLIELVLTLLVFVGLRVARVVGGALRRARFILCAFERRLLVTLAGALDTLFAVERELFLANVGLHRAHAVARLVQTVVDEELAVAIVFGDRVTVIVLLGALIQHFLPRVECAVRRCRVISIPSVTGIIRACGVHGARCARRLRARNGCRRETAGGLERRCGLC